MTCAEIKDRTIDYLYGELPAGARAAFEQHLAGCDSCRAEVGSLQGTLQQARAAVKMTDEAPPARVRVAVLEAARAAAGAVPMAARVAPVRARTASTEGPGFWEWLRRPWLLPLAGAAAAVAIFVVAREQITKPTLVEQVPIARSVEPSPSNEPSSHAAPAAPSPAQPRLDEAEAPAAAPRHKAAAPARKPAVRASTRHEAADELQNARSADLKYAPPPPPRPALQQDRDKAGFMDDALEGAASGGLRDVESRRAGGPGGAGTGYLGAGVKGEAAAEKKTVTLSNVPKRERAKAAAPAEMEPPPMRPAAAPQKEAYNGRAPVPATTPPPAAASAPAPSSAEEDRPATVKAKKDRGGPETPDERVDKANRLFTAGRWDEAAAAYRELLRLYPEDKSVPLWKGRLRVCEQALVPPPAAAKTRSK
jgi:hypothetical protein